MRSVSRLAVFTAALLVGAATIVASEESVRSMRVVEKPEDLATIFADAQTAVTYDSVSGRFYYPSLGLYFDPATSMFYDPSTGAYRDYALRGEYSYCGMDDMYYDAVSGLYFDAAKRMSFNPNTGLYLLDGAYYVWDSQFNMLRDPESGDYYDRGLEARVSYNASLDMFYDYNERKYYDPNLGLYYDEGMELFFDPICGRYYDRDAQMYYDPKTGNASLDADGTFYYDDMAGAYYNEKDGCWYEYDMSLDLYADRNSYGMGMMMGMGYGPRYYDPETEFHFNYDGSNYVVEETYDLYDPYSQCYFDLYNWTSYCYDPETGGFVYAMSDMSYTPYWMESGSYAWRADDDSTQNNVDLSNMYYDSMMGMYYDSYSMLYYDADDGMYYDGMSYYREPWGDSYWYDSMSQCYVSYRTGEHYTPSRSISPNGVDLSRMEYDSMRDLYYDSSTYLYYDAKIGLYTDFMNYYREPGGYGYYYDSMQNAYVCYSTGEVYHPHGQMGSIGQMYDQLTEGQLLEIQATFLALDYLSSLPAEIETMTEKRIEMGTYTAAPYGLEDVLWFKELMEQGMSYQERRIRLCRGVMPNTLEVSWTYSDPWSMPVPENYNSAGMVVPVSEALWNRAEHHVTFILNAGWMPCSMNALSIVHGGYGTGYYDSMYWYVSFGLGKNCLSESDQAVYNRFSNDWGMLNYLANMAYYGEWSVSTMYGDVDMVSGGSTTVGGLQDHDGDGLSDLDEIKYGTNPFMPDTDGDGLSDALEIRIDSCPTMYDEDSDYDGMADVWETYFGLNPENAVDANADPDHDGLNNLRECQLGTNPRSADTDGDGLRDGDELEHGTQPCNPDTDNDQLPDGAEVARGTNPCNPDTDLDGLLDGREVGLGLDPLSVDTNCDGIADSDEVEYQLLGLSAEAKATNEIAYRLRNWLPTDIEDLYSDFDADGTPDWVEYLGGFRPGNGSDVFLGTDGFPAVFVMTVNVEVEGLARPVMLDCNGEKVCVNRSCSIKRYCKEGEWHTLSIVGEQGSSVKVTVTYDDPRYAQHMVVEEDPQAVNGCSSLPGDSFANQHVSRKMKFCQPTVEIVNVPICFHGTGENRQIKKTLTGRIVPEGFFGECSWWPGPGDIDGHDEKDEIDGDHVNISREYVGLEVYCKVRFMMDYRLDGRCRVTHKPVTECVHKDTDAQQVAWCDIHDRELHICREIGIEDCVTIRDDHSKVPFLPEVHKEGGSTGDDWTRGVNETENDYGNPYYVGRYSGESIPVNSDDDNGDGNEDRTEQDHQVEGEDELRPLLMLSDCDECCPCHEGDGEIRIRKKDGKGMVKLWTDENKGHEVLSVVHDKIYVEGVEPSATPRDAGYFYEKKLNDAEDTIKLVEHAFTVYSVRLQPDLNHDGTVDETDAKLLPSMKSLGLGWCVIPEKAAALKLTVDVEMPGRVYARISGGVGTARLYTSGSDSAYQMTNLDKCQSATLQDSRTGTLELRKNDQMLWLEVLDPKMSGTIEVVYEGTDEAEGYECHAKINFQTLDFQIAGDGNRDGKVSFNSRADKSLTFWVNDDYDLIKYNEEMYQEDDTNQGLVSPVNHTLSRNCDDDIIGSVYGRAGENFIEDRDKQEHYCFRDLEDFDRIQLKIDPNICAIKGKGHALELKCQLVADDANHKPSINLFKAERNDLFFVQDTVDTSNMTPAEKKVAGRNAMISQMGQTCLVRVVPNSNPAQWQTVSETTNFTIDKSTCFLYEGCSVGKGKLNVRICSGGLVLVQASLNLSLHSARDFTEIYKVDGDLLNDATGVDEFNMNVKDVQTTPSSVKMPGRNNKEMTLLVLGWNVDPIEKEAWSDTFFKRLFWHGYKGRAGSFMWPCLYGQVTTFDVATDPPHFDRSEHRAWLSAPKAAAKFAEIVKDGTHLTLVAHSQGNILVGEALRRLTPEEKSRITYIAMQGAISAQMYTTSRQAPRDDPYGDGRYNLKVDSPKVKALINVGIARNKRRWGTGIYGNLWTLGGMLATDECESPDLFGHYPNGLETDKPYLDNALVGLRNKANFYNRKDYALEIWIGNHSTRPDNLAGTGNDDCSFGYKKGSFYALDGTGKDVKVNFGDQMRFYRNRNGYKYVIYPGDDSSAKGNEYGFLDLDRNGKLNELKRNAGGEAAKWCIFSFVVQTRSLAIGQVDMGGVFGDKETTPADEKHNINLETAYNFTNHHYYHSFEFRSNSSDTWSLWNSILKQIQK